MQVEKSRKSRSKHWSLNAVNVAPDGCVLSLRLEDRAVEALFFASEAEQDLLLAYFRLLASNPHAEFHYWKLDHTGRKNFADTCGPFTVAHWVDHAGREVRIVEFRRS